MQFSDLEDRLWVMVYLKLQQIDFKMSSMLWFLE